MENMKGYNLVIHGYFYSSLVFFLVQFKGKEVTNYLFSGRVEQKEDDNGRKGD